MVFLIGVAGGTASGKSSVCAKIVERLDPQHVGRVASISQDSFYRELSADENRRAIDGQFNFDHPDAFEHRLMLSVLRDLRAGKEVRVPKYDFCTNSRIVGDGIRVQPVDVILVEGILVFYDAELRDMFDMKLFVDADADIRLARRVERDTAQRGRKLDQVLSQYLLSVKPAFEEFCLPTKKYADVVIPRGADNEVAIALIVQHIQDLLRPVRAPASNANTNMQPHRHQNGDTVNVGNEVAAAGADAEIIRPLSALSSSSRQQPSNAVVVIRPH